MPKRKPKQQLRSDMPGPPTMPRLPTFVNRARGPRTLQALLTKPQVFESNAPPPAVPASLQATLPEFYVYYWLTKHDIEFDFQSSLLGGRAILGGLVADFMLPTMNPPMILNVQGLAYHFFGPFANPAKDERQRDELTNMGYQVLWCDEDDILERLDYTMNLAMQGIEISRGTWTR